MIRTTLATLIVLVAAAPVLAQDDPQQRLDFPADEAVVSILVDVPGFESRNGRISTGTATAYLADGTELALDARRTRRRNRGVDTYRLRSSDRSGPRLRCRFRVLHARPVWAERIRLRLSRWRTRLAHASLEFPAAPPVERAAWEPQLHGFGRTFDAPDWLDPDWANVDDVAIRADGGVVVLGTWTTATSEPPCLDARTAAARWDVTPDGTWTERTLGPEPVQRGRVVDSPRVLAAGGLFAGGSIERPEPGDFISVPLFCPDPSLLDHGIVWDTSAPLFEFGADDLTYLPARNVVGLSRATSVDDLVALIHIDGPKRWTAAGGAKPLDGSSLTWLFGMSDDGRRVVGARAKDETTPTSRNYAWWDESGVEGRLTIAEEAYEVRVDAFSGCGRWVAGSIRETGRFRSLVWDLDDGSTDPAFTEDWWDWDPSIYGLAGGEITDIASGGIAVGTDRRGAFLWMPGWEETRLLRPWLEDHGVDTSAWESIRVTRVRRDDEGIVFAGEGERHDGSWQLFVALVPYAR